jgi:outer membrane protein OmpA-like peptidoglycan-associated protein
MIGRGCAASLLVAAAAGAACGPKQVRPAPSGGTMQVVLLPDEESGTTGRAYASNAAGAVELETARASTSAATGQAPGAVKILSESEVQDVFGAALSALPPAPVHFTLFYKFDSDELTDESSALLPRILEAVQQRPTPDVIIIGHTDTTGTPASNSALGMKRAAAIRGRLIDAGLDAASVEATSHGEADLLVQTPDNVAEPRNRRVEITVR